MGIDRQDVRIVCHFNIPKSMEAFYQESGRAGRDQLPSRSLLYYGIDDRKRMEFILGNAESKKLQSSSSQGELSKKSLSNFNEMVEYCEGSGCRRKKILESFGEQASTSLCQKTCDACKHPNLVARYLEELTTSCTVRQRNSFSQVLTSSSTDVINEQYSEFWNRDDEASGSEEDISDSDDGIELAKSMSRSKFSKKPRLDEKINLLERAEEKYYQNRTQEKQVNKPDKNAISQTLRESSRQRLLDALKQAQQRLGDLKIDFEASSAYLENECFTKYGKSGKSFYYSQVASTVRWLSTTSSTELMDRLGTSITLPQERNGISEEEPPAISLDLLNEQLKETSNGEHHGNTNPDVVNVSPSPSACTSMKLPPIPSFSEFVNSSRKPRESKLNASENHPPRLEKIPDKRMRLT
ncbi:hypothetical protein SLEP1_g51362 [Rubroshorea leprosula]|uniref:DNA 3'-5' helicase n=2 Tax=Rubroshorea leprosula TaxID=152421 RepID=A0AAV5M309_9ROSI|nr:hypothetical protein SLEP1_g51362 [Rubroshorea leprosula]